MRLHPSLTEDEAYDWLKARADELGLEEMTGELEEELKLFAEAMAAIGSVVLPDDLEPLFP